jgi:hypothetical protein
MTNYKAFFIRGFAFIILSAFIRNALFAQRTDSMVESIKGKLVDINGYKLHINERGKGKGTVVLIAGSLAFSFDWYFVQKETEKFLRVIAYDRPGLAWSDAGSSPRTMKQDVY